MINTDLSFDEYRAIEAINASSIKKGRKSPLHMHDYVVHGTPDNEGLRKGRLAHAWTLEYDNRFERIAIYEGATSGKGSQTELKEFKLANEGMDIIKPAEILNLDAMREAVQENKEAKRILDEAAAEVTLQWKGNFGNAKGRLDKMGADYIADYKTVAPSFLSTDENVFARNALKMGIDLQMGWYAKGFEAHFERWPRVAIIAQENKRPWSVAVYWMDDKWVHEGAEEAYEIANLYKACKISDCYLGIQPLGAQVIYKPEWHGGDDDGEDVSTGTAKEGETL